MTIQLLEVNGNTSTATAAPEQINTQLNHIFRTLEVATNSLDFIIHSLEYVAYEDDYQSQLNDSLSLVSQSLHGLQV